MHGTTTLPLHAAPTSGADSPPAPDRVLHPARPPKPVRGRDLSLAVLGLLALGGAAALGIPPELAGGAALRMAPSVVLVDLAALTMTAPALLAVHQFMRLAARPEALVAGLGRALVHGGRVAGGLSVVVLFFSATTNLAIPMLLLALLAVGVFTSVTACVELARAERSATSDPAPGFGLLVVGWVALSWIIALRVGLDVGGWVFDIGRIGA
jgi:hypothetical protein